ncbi:MAG: GumC domain-containing protein [Candidatus Xenobia bacterium]
MFRLVQLLRRQQKVVLVVTLLAAAVLLLASQFARRQYASTATILINPPMTGHDGSTDSDWRTDFTVLKLVLLSQKFLTQVCAGLPERMSWQDLRLAIEPRLMAGRKGETNVIQIRVTTANQSTVQQTTAALVEAFKNYIPTMAAQEYTNNRVFLDGLVAHRKDELHQAERQVLQWQDRHQVLDVNGAASDYVQGLSRLQQKEAEAAQQVESLGNRVKQLRHYVQRGDVVPPWILLDQKNEHIPALQQNLSTERMKLSHLEETFQPDELEVIEQRAVVARAEEVLRTEVQTYIQSLLAEREADLEDAQARLHSLLRSEREMKQTWSLGKNSLEYTRLNHVITDLHSSLAGLTVQDQDAVITEQNAKRIGSIQVLAGASAPRPVNGLLPHELNARLILLLAFCGVLGVLGAMAWDSITTGLDAQPRIAETLEMPVLGVVPRLPSHVVAGWDGMRKAIAVRSEPDAGV